MIFSAEQLFSEDQAITVTAISENVIDTGVRGTPYGGASALEGDVGKGNPVCVLVQVTEDFATLTSLTIAIECDEAVGLDDDPTVLTSVTIAVADLVAGKQIPVQYLPNECTKRYLGVRYTVTGSDATAGTVQAGITMGNQTNIHGV